MKKVLIIVTLLLSTFFLYSQGRTNFHIGPTLPMGDFGDDDLSNPRASGAGVGVGLGIEYIYPLNNKGLGLFASFDINYNPIKNSRKNQVVDAFNAVSSGITINKDDITFYNFFNIPVSVGVNYTYKTNEKLSVYGGVGLVYNFLKITDLIIDVQGIETKSKFDLASSFGIKIGGGIILNDKIYLSLNYFGLGRHNIENTASNLATSISQQLKRTIDMLTVTIGFRL